MLDGHRRASWTSSASQRGQPGDHLAVDPAAAGRAGLTVEQVASQLAAAWLGEVATDLRLLDRTLPGARALPGRRTASIPRGWRDLGPRRRTARSLPLVSLARPVLADGRERADAREPAPDGARHRPPREPRPRQRGRRDPGRGSPSCSCRSATRYEVGGQYESQRQAFRELLLVFGAAAALVLRRPGLPVPRLPAGAAHPAGGAAVARRRLPAAAARPARSSTSPRPWG